MPPNVVFVVSDDHAVDDGRYVDVDVEAHLAAAMDRDRVRRGRPALLTSGG